MSVLTKNEVHIMRGVIRASRDEIRAILRKLDAFQVKVTDRDHIMTVNQFIKRADGKALKLATLTDGQLDRAAYDRVYHNEMNRLTRDAGLRV